MKRNVNSKNCVVELRWWSLGSEIRVGEISVRELPVVKMLVGRGNGVA